MTASFSAEILKLRKRPATWALGALVAFMVALFGYVFVYLSAPAEVSRELLVPQELVGVTLDVLARWAGSIALILGALVGGSEYGWNTLKTILTQRPGRLGVLSGKALGLGAAVAMIAVLSFAVASASSLLVSQAVGASSGAPGVWELVRGLGAAWLILGAFAAIGLALGVVLRSTAFAVGLGLVYGLVVENVVYGLSVDKKFADLELVSVLREVMVGPNAQALAGSFAPDALELAPAITGPAQAALVLAAYALGSAVIAAGFLSRRDVA